MNDVVNGGAADPDPKRRVRTGARSEPRAVRQAQLKALARALLRQAQIAAGRGDTRFLTQRLTELKRVIAQLGPDSGQAQLRAQVRRLQGHPPAVPAIRRPAKLCTDCAAQFVNRAKKYCDGCATRRGFLECRRCGGMFDPAGRSGVQFALCQKCSNADRSRSRSVRTVSGGLPTLGKRR